jgi:hypothetical protein
MNARPDSMKANHLNVSIILGAVCLTLSVFVSELSSSNRSFRVRLHQQQVQIDKYSQYHQLETNISGDMARVSGTNEAIRNELAKSGLSQDPASGGTSLQSLGSGQNHHE